jgi:polar amino acid transport system substrate-binding protein
MSLMHRRLMLALAAGLLSAAGMGTARAADCKPAVADSDLVKPGTLVMSTNPTQPPLQYVDDQGNLVGMRIELGNEIARRLCLEPDYVRINFDAMIPGLQAGRWDMINTGLFYTPERAKLMKLVRYESQAVSISVPKGNPGHITKIEDLVGKRVGVEVGGYEENTIRALSKKLEEQGAGSMKISTFNSFADAYNALRAGQLDAVVSIDGVAKHYQDTGAFDRALHGLAGAPVAFAFKSEALAEAVAKALDAMKAEGTYQKIFGQYGLTPLDVASFKVG